MRTGKRGKLERPPLSLTQWAQQGPPPSSCQRSSWPSRCRRPNLPAPRARSAPPSIAQPVDMRLWVFTASGCGSVLCSWPCSSEGGLSLPGPVSHVPSRAPNAHLHGRLPEVDLLLAMSICQGPSGRVSREGETPDKRSARGVVEHQAHSLLNTQLSISPAAKLRRGAALATRWPVRRRERGASFCSADAMLVRLNPRPEECYSTDFRA